MLFTTVGTQPDDLTLERVNGILRQRVRNIAGQTGVQIGQIGTRFVGGQSTNSGSFIDVPNSAIELETRGGVINAGLFGSPNSFAYLQVNASATTAMTWGLGLRYETDVPTFAQYNLVQVGSGTIQMQLGVPGMFIKKAVPAGIHTFTLMFRGPGSGSAQIRFESCSFVVWEEF